MPTHTYIQRLEAARRVAKEPEPAAGVSARPTHPRERYIHLRGGGFGRQENGETKIIRASLAVFRVGDAR